LIFNKLHAIVVFENGNSTLIHQTTTAAITIGSYTARLTFLICPIGNQIILGTPWFSSVEASVCLGQQTNPFQFKSAGKLYNFPLMTETSLENWNQQTKKKIGFITAKELERQHRTASIFDIDIKEIVDESSTQGKLSSEATAKDAGVLNGFPIDLQKLIQQFADQFDPPTKLPPARPEDVQSNSNQNRRDHV
jgi:hypothetical protein